MTEIRVLAVRQPWAYFIVNGRKTLEIRNTVTNYRGRIAIYASLKVPTKKELNTLICYFGSIQRKCYDEYGYIKDGYLGIFNEAGSYAAYIDKYRSKEFCKSVAGKIIGTVDIIDCNRFSSNLEFENTYGDHLCPPDYIIPSKTCKWTLSNPDKFPMPRSFKWNSTGAWSKTNILEDYK